MVFCFHLIKCSLLNGLTNARKGPMACKRTDYADPTWLSKDFLQNIFIEATNDSTVQILESKIEDSTHEGCFSSVKHITLRYQKSVDHEQTEGEYRLVAKTLPNEEGKEAMIANSSVFSTEIKMYKETLPAMFELLNNVAPGKYGTFQPKCLYTECDPCVLMLEDLSCGRYKHGDTTRGLDFEHSKNVMQTLARFHALSIALHCKNPASVECYSENLMLTKSSTAYMTSFITCQIDLLSDAIEDNSDRGSELAERLQLLKSSLLSKVRCCIKNDSTNFRVLTHGDLWTSNALFRYDKAGEFIEDVKFIDFQLCYFSSPSFDLQYFFSTSLTRDVHCKYKMRLLEKYHEELCKILTILDLPNKIVTLQELLEDFESKDFFGFFWTLMALPLILPNKPSKSLPKKRFNELNKKENCEIIYERLRPYECRRYF